MTCPRCKTDNAIIESQDRIKMLRCLACGFYEFLARVGRANKKKKWTLN